jgi:cephalosporin hydroxylase
MRPPNMQVAPEMSFGEYRGHRFYQTAHTRDTYRGRTIAKLPEDLRTYQHVIEETRPTHIIELGTYEGGSALWFADQLDVLCGGGMVISVDIAKRKIKDDDRIRLIHGDLADAPTAVLSHITDWLPQRVMVVDDSAHTYQSTSDALRLYGPMVSVGCYFVVEDGFVEGCGRAIDDFMVDNTKFERQDLMPYGVTSIPRGWLKRV